MPTEVTSNIYANFGLFGLIAVSFFGLVFWVLKTSSKREDKLYVVIDTLTKELPEIKRAIEEISRKIR